VAGFDGGALLGATDKLSVWFVAWPVAFAMRATRIVAQIQAAWPRVRILLRGDSGFIGSIDRAIGVSKSNCRFRPNSSATGCLPIESPGRARVAPRAGAFSNGRPYRHRERTPNRLARSGVHLPIDRAIWSAIKFA